MDVEPKVKVGIKRENLKIFHIKISGKKGLPLWLSSKESACKCRRHRRQFCSLGQEDPLEEEMAIHSSILTWRIPRTEQPGGLQSMGAQRVRHD